MKVEEGKSYIVVEKSPNHHSNPQEWKCLKALDLVYKFVDTNYYGSSPFWIRKMDLSTSPEGFEKYRILEEVPES